MNEKIVRLTELWYAYVGLDHHKDSDCHWYIETAFSYGSNPEYIVRHDGYIIGEVAEVFKTYEKAQIGLIKEIVKVFESEYKEIKNIEDDEFKEKLIFLENNIKEIKGLI